MRLHYPSDNRFSEENFADQPLILIEQALAAIEEKNVELGAMIGQLTTRLGIQTVSAHAEIKDAEKMSHYLNPYAHIQHVRDLRAKVPMQYCQTLLWLFNNYKVPEFVWQWISYDDARAIAGEVE